MLFHCFATTINFHPPIKFDEVFLSSNQKSVGANKKKQQFDNLHQTQYFLHGQELFFFNEIRKENVV